MHKGEKLLVRLFVSVIKQQAKRYLGDDAVDALVDAGSDFLSEELLDLLKENGAGRELAERLAEALPSAASELERELPRRAALRLNNAPTALIEAVTDALIKLNGDLVGRRLQEAVQDLVAAVGPREVRLNIQVSTQLYQALLMVAGTIPELHFRAQDLLLQSRIWVVGEQLNRMERLASTRKSAARPTHDAKGVNDNARALPPPPHTKVRRNRRAKDGLRAGLRFAENTVELVERLGHGGLGSVWKGRVIATGELVAVKFLNRELNQDSEIVSAFQGDIEGLTALAGSAVPTVIQGATFEKGRHFYIYQYSEGAFSLDTVLDGVQAPLSKKLGILCTIAEVLHSFHRRGWIHGDVKPSNILLVGGIDGRVQFIDFGSSRRMSESAEVATVTFTAAYAAPELRSFYRGVATVSRPAGTRLRANASFKLIAPTWDIYPLGVMLFQALDPGLARVGRMEEYWLISRVITTLELKAVLRRAMAPAPSERFQTALEFASALKNALRSATEADVPQ